MKRLFILLLALGGSRLECFTFTSNVSVMNRTAYPVQIKTMYKGCKPAEKWIQPGKIDSLTKNCLIMDIKAFVKIGNDVYGTAATGKNKRSDANGFKFGTAIINTKNYTGASGDFTFEVTGTLETGLQLKQY